MEGTIKISVFEEGGITNVTTECDVRSMSLIDKFGLLYSICQSLHLDECDVQLFTTILKTGVFNTVMKKTAVGGGIDNESGRK